MQKWLLGLMLAFLSAGIAQADESLTVWCDQVVGKVRPLHGVNGGPLNFGEIVNLADYWKELEIPITRLHDCEWPAPVVVDVHAFFPLADADPSDPNSYQFTRTDDYLQSIANVKTDVVYRLGESIEHTKRKYYVHPPKDNAKWTAACVGLIRHVNEGWAEGTHRNIRYWEIWNEPENRPAMWTGTDEQFYELYSTAAKGIKKAFPNLMVGGPGAAAPGEIVDGKLKPAPFLQGLIKHCKETGAPLDFFSWHGYTADPLFFGAKAKAIREWLDSEGFTKTEIHLNEWNYLPQNDWAPLFVQGPAEPREKWYDEMGSVRGAAFLASVLMDLQESPVDVANFYSGDTNPFGLFTRHGVPKKNFYGMKLFSQLTHTPQRLAITRKEPGKVIACAGGDSEKDEVQILLSQFQGSEQQVHVNLTGKDWLANAWMQVCVVDEKRNGEPGEVVQLTKNSFAVDMPASGVVLVKLRKVKE